MIFSVHTDEELFTAVTSNKRILFETVQLISRSVKRARLIVLVIPSVALHILTAHILRVMS